MTIPPPRAAARLAVFVLAAAAASTAAARIALQTPEFLATGLDPAAVAFGDVDGDGLVDLVVANRDSNTVSVLRQEDDEDFAARRNYDVGGEPSDVALGDVDGDGALDLVVTSADEDRVQAWRNVAGAFAELMFEADTGDAPAAVALGDVDGDGDLDVVVANGGGTSITLVVVQAGAVAARRNYGVGAEPLDVAVADLDGDGRADVVTAIADDAFVTYLGEAGGTLGSRRTVDTEDKVAALALADLDDDGAADVVVLSATQGTLESLLNDGAGRFAEGGELLVDSVVDALDLALADFDGDGRIDAMVVAGDGALRVHPGSVAGRFTVGVTANVSATLFALEAGLVDSDVRPDLVGVALDSNQVALVRGAVAARFAAAVSRGVGDAPAGLAAGDVDMDGVADVLASISGDGQIELLLGATDEDKTLEVRVSSAAGGSPRGALLADLDNDGRLDAVAVDVLGDAVGVHRGTGTDVLGARRVYTVGASPIDVAVGDLDGDGRLEILSADLGANTVSVLRHDGTDYALAATVAVGDRPNGVVAADLDGDGKLDIATADYGAGTVTVRRGDGALGFLAPVELAVGGQPAALVAHDLDGDGDLDLAVANFAADRVDVLIATAPATLGFELRSYKAGDAPRDVAVGDLDGDGFPELVVAASAADAVTIRYGAAGGDWPLRADLAAGAGPHAVTLADVDADARLDVITADFSGDTVSVALALENVAPTASDMGFLLDLEDDKVTRNYLGGSDEDGDRLTFRIVREPRNGTLTLIDPVAGLFEYDPESGFDGTDSFTYEVEDGTETSNVATVVIEVESAEEVGIGAGDGWLLAGLLALLALRLRRA